MKPTLLNTNQLSHINRYGDMFFVRMRKTARGRRYFMVKSPDGALSRLPEGHEIREDVNGRVSIVRVRHSPITRSEVGLVSSALRQLRSACYEVECRGRVITIYASAGDCHSLAESIEAEFAEGFAAVLEAMFARKYGHELADLFRSRRIARDGTQPQPRYYPLLRFVLVDEQSRRYAVQRIYFTGDTDWLRLEELTISAAIMKYIPHLGKNSFFDLL